MNIDTVTVATQTLAPSLIEATPAAIREEVPEDEAGAYMLFLEGHPMYVGRSDACMRTRLAGHEHLQYATHVAWRTRSSAEEAFYLESAWYHQAGGREHLLNAIHPRIPDGAMLHCPFCESTIQTAFREATETCAAVAQ